MHAVQPATDTDLSFLRSRATKYAFYGVLIASASVVIATLLVSYVMVDEISIDGVILAQTSNIALWTMDAMPFVFAAWGQYASFKMAREANELVDTRTQTLRQALSDMKFTSQAKSDFFAKMSHEFRTPINGIIGMIELLLASGLDKTQRRHADIIKTSATGLLTLINDILDFSKIEAGKLELEEVEFDLHECIEGAVAILIQQAQMKGLALTTLIQPDMPRRLIGDPGRLRQIIINLISNAIKFTETGEIILSAKKIQEDGDGNIRIRVEVADTGIGIPEKAQAGLFQTYNQADTSTSRRYGGTGLGLAITKELVVAMGGKISVVSKEKKGSTFWFTVLMRKSTSERLAVSSGTTNLKGIRTLVAHANEPARAILADQLRVLGMEVEEVGDGVVALQKVIVAASSGRPFDVVLTDMVLPRMSGEELGWEIKSNPEIRDTVLVMLTAAGVRGEAQRMNQIGFAGYFGKPVPAVKLQDMLVSVLATRGVNEAERQRHGIVTSYSMAESRLSSQRVLLAEDSEVNREIMLHTLSRYGLVTDIALNGVEAVEAVRRTDYGLVLMDLRMPDVDGIQALQIIRAMPNERARIPVVILTAGATDVEKKRCMKYGANDFLVKPVNDATFRQALSRWLMIPGPEEHENAALEKQPGGGEAVPDLQLIRIFLNESSQRMNALREAIANADAPRVAREAHTLKNTSTHVHDTALRDAAARLEQMADRGNLNQAESLLNDLENAYARLRPALEQKLANQS